MIFSMELFLTKSMIFWYLFAIEIIDTQVARRGRQYHSQPTALQKPSYKCKPSYKKPSHQTQIRKTKYKNKNKKSLQLLSVNNRDFMFLKARIEVKKC